MASGFTAYGGLESETGANSTRIEKVEELSKERHDAQGDQLKRIEEKVDRLLEHLING